MKKKDTARKGKKRNMQDATLINVRAVSRRILRLEQKMVECQRVAAMMLDYLKKQKVRGG